jgi:hypothetical protein
MEFPEELISKHKEIISDIITKFNQIENLIKKTITSYIASDKTEFINDILLNNLILNFSSKYKILQYIITIEKIEVNKKFNNSIKILMSNRNIIAHSDNLLDYEITPIEENLFFTNVLKFPRYTSPFQKVEPKNQTTINNGKIQSIEIDKIHKDFIKHFEIAIGELKTIKDII